MSEQINERTMLGEDGRGKKRYREVFLYSDEDEAEGNGQPESTMPPMPVPSSLSLPSDARLVGEWVEDVVGKPSEGEPSLLSSAPGSRVQREEADNGFQASRTLFEERMVSCYANRRPRRLHPEDFVYQTLGLEAFSHRRGKPRSGGGDAEDDEAVHTVVGELAPVLDEASRAVVAVTTREGYQLSVKEEDFREEDEESGEEAVRYSDGLPATTTSTATSPPEEVGETEVAGEMSADGDEEEEEEEEALDDLLTVAVAQRLVEGFESEEGELTPELTELRSSFLSTIRPLLQLREEQRKTLGEDEADHQFAVEAEPTLKRVLWAYQKARRPPKEDTVVIDGIVMDF